MTAAQNLAGTATLPATTTAPLSSSHDVTAAQTADNREADLNVAVNLDSNWSKIVIPDDPEFWEYWQQFAADEMFID
jgi:hypothetical protein